MNTPVPMLREGEALIVGGTDDFGEIVVLAAPSDWEIKMSEQTPSRIAASRWDVAQLMFAGDVRC